MRRARLALGQNIPLLVLACKIMPGSMFAPSALDRAHRAIRLRSAGLTKLLYSCVPHSPGPCARKLHVARKFANRRAPPLDRGPAPRKISSTPTFAGGSTLNVLARACELSKRHFTRAFRQSTGAAPHQWLQYRRMEKAKHLLDKSSASLSSIALDCGFADQSHFTRKFSDVVGITPGNWRRKMRE